MDKLETDIEQAIVDWATARGWETIKLNLQGNRGWPDRLFISTVGTHVWLEVKRPGEEPRKLQKYRIKQLRKRAVAAHWTDNLEEAQEILTFWET